MYQLRGYTMEPGTAHLNHQSHTEPAMVCKRASTWSRVPCRHK